MAQMKLSTENKIMNLENRLVAAKGKGEGVGYIGNLGLIDVDSCLWNGLAMRSYCVALGTMSFILEYDNMRKKNRYMYV